MHELPGKPALRAPARKRRRVRTIALLPTLLTLGNAICGFLAMIHAARGAHIQAGGGVATASFQQAGWLILLAMIFDALDGKVARMTRTASSFGTQLDSLCDFLTFGVAPAFLTYSLARPTSELHDRAVLVVCVFYFCCAATRLARFNVETGVEEKHHREFSGLPSPAAAGVIATTLITWPAGSGRIPMLSEVNEFLQGALPVMLFLLGVAMVSRFPYPHVVNRLFQGVRPFVTLLELAVVVLLGVLFHEFALFLGFLAYALVGPVAWLRHRTRPADAAAPAPRESDSAF